MAVHCHLLHIPRAAAMTSTRRNGQLSSCEPCRKAKLRCDQTVPICGRCDRRGLQDQCLYHPAPLTRPDIPRTRRTRQITHRLHRGQSVSVQAAGVTWDQKKLSLSAPGFLGHTSYSDALTDTNSGNLLSIDEAAHNQTNSIVIDSERVHLGAQILMLLRDLPFYRKVVTARFKIWEGWFLGWQITDAIFKIVEDKWGSLEKEFDDESDRALLMSRQLFQANTRPFLVHPGMSWPDFVFAASVRWEVVGLLFCIAGLATQWISDADPIFKQPGSLDSKSLATTASTVSDICLQFCDSAGILNDLVSWLLVHHTVLLTVVYGESDNRPWRKLGELSTTVFALGLHQDSSSDVPFFLTELRKRTMVAAFIMDKILATFLGRPPLISWRYCDIAMPLDLSFEEIFASAEVRAAALARLEKNGGWNHEGTLTKGAWARINLFRSIQREKILELSLSCRIENIQRRVERLSEENRRMRLDLPEFLHWNPTRGTINAPAVEDGLLFSLHLDFLYDDLLLYRILQKRTQAQPSGIITTSREILSTLLTMVGKSTLSGYPLLDLGWNMCYVGLPAAGILSAELLRRSRSTLSAIETAFPRSEIIQNLSIFASYLDHVIQSNEGNYQVSQQGQRIIRHVLDQVLSVDISSPMLNSLETPPDTSAIENLLEDVDIADRQAFLGWLDGSVEQRQDSWLGWVNFS
ncbi:Transcription factor [Penicillium canariense]|uniref:Transcription factor n=1 Tax=Penicillium canariense TaxID=189055 RepID=A0A9W9I414_9EURO|nr:Transcription factor [Penicillium canariense]KAJ5167565.1 Transcription factor [Penicillium canariense]